MSFLNRQERQGKIKNHVESRFRISGAAVCHGPKSEGPTHEGSGPQVVDDGKEARTAGAQT